VRQAIGYYEQALEIAREIGDQRNEGAHLGNLGNAYAALGDVRQAIGYYEQALEIAREIGDRRMEGNALGNLGLAYAALGDAEKARQCVAELEALGMEDYGTYLNMGNIYSALENEIAAAQAYSHAIELAPEVGMLYRNRASSYLKLQRLDEAEKDCRKAEELEPDHPYTFARRAEWWWEKGEYAQAISTFQEALARADRAEWHYNLGLTFLLSGDAEAARAAYTEGVERARGTVLRDAIRELERRLEGMPERTIAEEILAWLKSEADGEENNSTD
jgi:tetratricopeptide (TPR) repeat protein